MCHSYHTPFNCSKCGEITPYCQCEKVCSLCGEILLDEPNEDGTCYNCEEDFSKCSICNELHLNVDFVGDICFNCYDSHSC